MAHLLAPDAEADLDEIWLYVARESHSPDTADRLVDALTERFWMLARHPHTGRTRGDLRPGLRSFAVGSYVISYRRTGRTSSFSESCMAAAMSLGSSAGVVDLLRYSKVVAEKSRIGWFPAVALAWVVPGGGHMLLKRSGRGALILASVLSLFLLGLMMEGALFWPQTGDLLTTVIYCGGFVGNVLAGLPYFFSVWLGYSVPDMAGHVHDYGTKFLVAAGLLNLLGMVDAFEIATGRKD